MRIKCRLIIIPNTCGLKINEANILYFQIYPKKEDRPG